MPAPCPHDAVAPKGPYCALVEDSAAPAAAHPVTLIGGAGCDSTTFFPAGFDKSKLSYLRPSMWDLSFPFRAADGPRENMRRLHVEGLMTATHWCHLNSCQSPKNATRARESCPSLLACDGNRPRTLHRTDACRVCSEHCRSNRGRLTALRSLARVLGCECAYLAACAPGSRPWPSACVAREAGGRR